MAMEQLDTKLELMKRTLWEWLDDIEGPNKQALDQFLAADDHRARLEKAPGSRSAHQAWEGGWMEHERQTMMIANHLYELFVMTGRFDEIPEGERFSLGDAYVVMFLHDIEKPFVYDFSEDGSIVIKNPMTKQDRKEFRKNVIEQYGFILSPTMVNALKYVEGERDIDYVPGGRAEQPLASLCQVADNLSARAFYDHGRPQ